MKLLSVVTAYVAAVAAAQLDMAQLSAECACVGGTWAAAGAAAAVVHCRAAGMPAETACLLNAMFKVNVTDFAAENQQSCEVDGWQRIGVFCVACLKVELDRLAT